MTDNIEYYRNQIALARTEIKNLRQQMSSLKQEHIKEIKYIKTHLNLLRCANCADSATTIASNHNGGDFQPLDPEDLIYKPIGVIETSFQNKRGVPRQTTIMSKARGTAIINNSVYNNPEHALSGLEEFSHIWILFHFHMTESTNSPAKVAPPRLGGERRGVFSTRTPHRPCPIGLSLVKIEKIEGNKIYFLGVDMVNGTPLLDIKPYIPQYDYPAPAFGNTSMSSLVRPPTEGISDVVDSLATLPIDDEAYDARSVSPRIANPNGIDASPSSSSPSEGPSPDHPSNANTPISPSSETPSSELREENYRSTSNRRPDTERGAPDGQERYTPPQSARLTSITHDGIRVAPWISNPPSQSYDVRFTDDAYARLNELIGDRAQAFKANIECLLSDDPRSQYVKNRYPDHEYSCILEDLSISCVFDANSSVCTIIAVRNAEDLQT